MAALSPTSKEFTNCDVFLSYKGNDDCDNFIGFLHRDLKRLGIKVYKPDEELLIGQDIYLTLRDMIHQSKISIIVFSENYADSKWCLQELREIVECHRSESNGQIILPIYFDVEPSHVRNQMGSFGTSIERHMKDFDEMTVEGWKYALRVVGDVRGLDLGRENRDQSRLVDLVVNSVSTILNTQPALNYDAFLSFRGVDTRCNFTAFLYRELKRVGINVFMDNEGLWVGEEIEPMLLEAIQSSKVSIIIISEHYAGSKWCLVELAEIVRCHKSDGQQILPVFLGVDPMDVRNLTGNIETSFQKLEDRIDKDKKPDIIQWKDALKVVGGIRGATLRQVNGDYSELVDIVVNLVLRGLYRDEWLDQNQDELLDQSVSR